VKNITKLIGSVILASSIIGMGAAHAATETGTLTVTATVSKYCSIGDGTLAFGDLSLFTTTGTGVEGYAAGNKDADSTAINVFCSKGTTANVNFSGGANAGTSRQMKSPTTLDLIPYHLYTNTGRSAAIDMTGTTGYYNLTGTGVVGTGVPQQTITVYGRVVRSEALNPTPATDYTDTVTMTINY
jgi:spore coat protein U-like protein